MPDKRQTRSAFATLVTQAPEPRPAAQPQDSGPAQPPERTTAEPPAKKPKVLSRGVNADFALLDACKLLAVKQRRKLKDVFNEACRDILHKYGEPIPDTDGDA